MEIDFTKVILPIFGIIMAVGVIGVITKPITFAECECLDCSYIWHSDKYIYGWSPSITGCSQCGSTNIKVILPSE